MRAERTRRVRVTAYAALVVGLVGVMGLGVAAPAQAFAVPPVSPEPVMLSSELAALGTAGEGATAASSTAVAAFAPVLPLAVAGIGFRIGFAAAGMVMAPFGISPTDGLCQITGGGDVPLNMATNALTGADCSAQMTANTLPVDQQNADQTGGYVVQPFCDTAGNCVNGLTGFSQVGFNQYSGVYSAAACFTATATLPSANVVFRRAADGATRTAAIRLSNSYVTGSYFCSAGAAAVIASEYSLAAAQTDIAGTTFLCVSADATCTSAGAQPVSEGPSGNPSRHYECKITGNDGNTYTASSDSFTQTDPNTAPLKCPTLPGGVLPTNAEVTLVTPGEADQVVVPEVASTSAYQTAATAYPDCATASCHLQVWTADGKNCATVGTCADWFTDPAKASDYQCHYGTHVVDLSECNVMSSYYDPQKQASGQAYADPTTGEPVMNPDPTTGVETPVQTSPKTGEAISTETPQDAPSRGNCFPTGWSAFNPLNWVLQPVQCAWEWAMVPRQSVIDADNETMKANVNKSAVGSVTTLLNGIGAFAAIDGGGCSGIPWDFHMDFPGGSIDQHYALLAACPGDPLAQTAATAKSIATGVVWTAAALAWIRYIASIVGYVRFGGETQGPTMPSGPLSIGELRVARTGLDPGSGRKAIGS